MYYRLSAFYLFYFAAIGALVPYWSVYLKSLGYGAEEIGALIAIIMVTKIVAPYIWGWIADRSGRRIGIVRLASLLAFVTFGGVFLGSGFWWLALVMCLFSFFWNASLPQFEALTLNYLGNETQRYSSIRLWGSMGFILAVIGLGYFLEYFGIATLPVVLMLLFLGIWLGSLAVPEQRVGQRMAGKGSIFEALRQPGVLTLLLLCFLMQLSHGPYYTFFSIYLEDNGYSRSDVGQLWALGVIAEIGVFLVMHRLLPRLGARTLLVASLMLTTLRWFLISLFVQHPALIITAQVLHAASFGVYHAVMISLIHKYFYGQYQGRGQALYSSLSFGAGGALGSFISGYAWTALGPRETFFLAAVVSAAAVVIAWRGLRPGSSPLLSEN